MPIYVLLYSLLLLLVLFRIVFFVCLVERTYEALLKIQNSWLDILIYRVDMITGIFRVTSIGNKGVLCRVSLLVFDGKHSIDDSQRVMLFRLIFKKK